MRFPLLIAGAFACLSFAVSAAECEFPFDDIVGDFAAAGAPVAIIPDADLADIVDQTEEALGQEFGEATRGFFAVAGGKVLLGIEVDGCMLDPIVVGLATPAGQKLSGRDKETGRIGA